MYILQGHNIHLLPSQFQLLLAQDIVTVTRTKLWQSTGSVQLQNCRSCGMYLQWSGHTKKVVQGRKTVNQGKGYRQPRLTDPYGEQRLTYVDCYHQILWWNWFSWGTSSGKTRPKNLVLCVFANRLLCVSHWGFYLATIKPRLVEALLHQMVRLAKWQLYIYINIYKWNPKFWSTVSYAATGPNKKFLVYSKNLSFCLLVLLELW